MYIPCTPPDRTRIFRFVPRDAVVKTRRTDTPSRVKRSRCAYLFVHTNGRHTRDGFPYENRFRFGLFLPVTDHERRVFQIVRQTVSTEYFDTVKRIAKLRRRRRDPLRDGSRSLNTFVLQLLHGRPGRGVRRGHSRE